MKFKLSFDPPEPRNQNKPGFRKPVRILCDDHEIGYFVFSERNVFQIFLYVDFQEKAGWREVLLDQGFFSWNEKKRHRAEGEIAAEMRMAREMLERQLRHAESEIERVRGSYIPKSGKKTKKERPRETVVRQPDLFSM